MDPPSAEYSKSTVIANLSPRDLRRLHWPLILWLLLASPANGGTASLEDDFVLENFTTEAGLPGNTIRAIDQTGDGYLWLFVSGSLARFDGVKFTLFDSSNTPELRRDELEFIHVDCHGTLWIFCSGKRISRYQNGKLVPVPTAAELPDLHWRFNGEPPSGRVSIEAPDGSHQWFENGKFGPSSSRFVFGTTLPEPLWSDRGGHLWWRDGSEWRRGTFQDLGAFLPEINGKRSLVMAVRPSRNGEIWVLAERGLCLRDKGTWKVFPSPSTLSEPTSMVEDSRGNIWIGTWTQGLWRVNAQGQYQLYPLTRGKQPEAVRSLFEDREGNLWLGTEGSGLFRIKPRLFRTYTASDGLSGEVIRSVTCSPEGQVWMMNQSGLDELDRAASEVRHVADVDLGWCVFYDRDARLWMGSYVGGVRSRDGSGWHDWAVQPKARGEAITCFFQDKQRTVWIGTSDGLLQTGQDCLHLVEGPAPGTRFDVRAIAEDAQGRLYVGTRRDGVWIYENKTWRKVRGSPGSAELPVRALLADREDILWIGTENHGLWQLNQGNLFHFGDESGLPASVNSIVEDDLGSFWLGSNQGLFRIAKGQLDGFASGRAGEINPIRYTKTDGLRTTEMTGGRQPTACKSADGRLWFATVKGVSTISPTAIAPNVRPATVIVESVRLVRSSSEPGTVDGTEKAIDRAHESEVRVPAGNRQIEIQFTATSFTAPDRVRFRYQMEGADEGWVEAGSRRSVYYHGLAPGKYRFRVIASNSDGIWDSTGATLPFLVLPFFWQTVGFKILAIGSIAGMAYGVYRWRLAQVKAMVRLRGRIAGDLHDEIGANLGSIGLNADLLRAGGGLAPRQTEDLEGISRLTALTSQAVRDVVWFVNPDFDNSAGMILRMRELAGLMLAGKKWTFDAPESTPSMPLDLEFRRNVFFIFKECLHNIVKHSKASTVRVRLDLQADHLRLEIQDNGIGFDAQLDGTGSGLRNLRRRAAELHGKLEVLSSAATGTRVTLEAVPRKPHPFWSWIRNQPHENS